MHFFQKSPRCALIGACAVNRATTVISSALYCNKGIKYESLFSGSIGKGFLHHFFFFACHGSFVESIHTKDG